MRPKENYTRYVTVAFVLTLAILVLFQIYLWREPGRIAADEAQDELIAETLGRELYADNCVMCHGEEGEGVDGPPLNDSRFLKETANQTIFSLIGSGVPSSEMPAWNQVHGGPFTDEQVLQLVAFIRNWEADAPDRQAIAMAGDPVNGLTIFNSTCVVCHGEEGRGGERAPALNDPDKLTRFDDDWYRETISDGRPAQGMPTWGTVLSPVQISDLVAMLRVWERGETIRLPGPEEALAEAFHLLDHGDFQGAEHVLGEATRTASGEMLAVINEAIEAIEAGDMGAAEAAVRQAQAILDPDNMDAEEHDDTGEAEHDDTGEAEHADTNEAEHDDADTDGHDDAGGDSGG